MTIAHFTLSCVDNRLRLNVIKTKEIVISPPPQIPNVINNQTTEIVNCFKYLGVTLDSSYKRDKRSHRRPVGIHKLNFLCCPHLPLLLYQHLTHFVVLFHLLLKTCFFFKSHNTPSKMRGLQIQPH